MREIIEKTLKSNKTRFFDSQPMSVSYSKTIASHKVRGVTTMQEAFMNALLRG